MLADVLHKVAGMEQEDATPYAIRPSLASPETADSPGRCKRAMTYWRRGETPAPWPGRFVLVLDDSSWHEELTADWIRKTAYRLHSQQMAVDIPLPQPLGGERFCGRCRVPIPPTVLHGHIDGIFTDLLGVDRLLEMKALNHFGFQRLLNEELPLDYLTQACLYLRGLRTLSADLREAVLLVKNKNTAAYLEYRLSHDPEEDLCHVVELVASDGTRRALDVFLPGLVTTALRKFEEVEQHAAARTLPPRPFARDTWQCDYCRFGERCWQGFEAEHAAFAQQDPLPPEADTLFEAYWKAGNDKRAGEATLAQLRPALLRLLQQREARSGKSAGFRVTWALQPRRQLVAEKLPPDVREAATVPQTIDVLTVRPLRDPCSGDAPPGEGPDGMGGRRPVRRKTR